MLYKKMWLLHLDVALTDYFIIFSKNRCVLCKISVITKLELEDFYKLAVIVQNASETNVWWCTRSSILPFLSVSGDRSVTCKPVQTRHWLINAQHTCSVRASILPLLCIPASTHRYNVTHFYALSFTPQAFMTLVMLRRVCSCCLVLKMLPNMCFMM